MKIQTSFVFREKKLDLYLMKIQISFGFREKIICENTNQSWVQRKNQI